MPSLYSARKKSAYFDLATSARVGTQNGHKLIAFWLKVFEDEDQPMMWRMAAADRLADRGFGKAVQFVESIEDMEGEQLEKRYSLAELKEIRDAMNKLDSIEVAAVVVPNGKELISHYADA